MRRKRTYIPQPSHPLAPAIEQHATQHARDRIGARSQQAAGAALAQRIGTAAQLEQQQRGAAHGRPAVSIGQLTRTISW